MPAPVMYVVAAILWLGAAPMPYGYHTLLRLIACATFTFAVYAAVERKHKILPWVYGLAALVFNPIIEVHFPRELWMFVDISAGIFLLATTRTLSTYSDMG